MVGNISKGIFAVPPQHRSTNLKWRTNRLIDFNFSCWTFYCMQHEGKMWSGWPRTRRRWRNRSYKSTPNYPCASVLCRIFLPCISVINYSASGYILSWNIIIYVPSFDIDVIMDSHSFSLYHEQLKSYKMIKVVGGEWWLEYRIFNSF